MKIAFLHQTLGLADRGSERAVSLVASALAKKHELLVLHSGGLSNPPFPHVRILPLAVSPPASPRNFADKLRFRFGWDQRTRSVREFTLAAIPALRRFQPDLIIPVNGSTQVRLIRRDLPEAKVAVFGHAGIGYDDAANLKADPDLFVALTPAAATWARSRASSRTTVVQIANPIDTVEFGRARPTPLTLPKPVVLTVGALSAYKNIDAVVSAVSRTGSALLLIGDGERAPEIRKLLDQSRFTYRWLPHVSSADMPRYFAAADCFCLVPDPQEAFGLVYLEAMAAGLPIVASADPIRRELIGPQGFYSDPHDPARLESQIRAAVQTGRKDYSRQLQPYKLASVVKQIEEVFRALVA